MNWIARGLAATILVIGITIATPNIVVAQSGYVAVQGQPVVTYVPERAGLLGLRTVYRPVVTVPTTLAPVYHPAPHVTQMPVIQAPTLGQTHSYYTPQPVAPTVTTYYTPAASSPAPVTVYHSPQVYIAPPATNHYRPVIVSPPPITVQRPIIIWP